MEDKVLCRFQTQGFADNPTESIAMATGVGMAFMFLGILLGASVWLSMALLIGGILAVYGYRAGSVEYLLYTWGIEQRLRRFIPYQFAKKESTRRILWSDIKSFKNDRDLSRSQGEYEYLKFYLKTAPGQIWITDQKNKPGFEQFRTSFLEAVKSPESAEQPDSVRSTTTVAPKPLVERKPGFYDTFWAKVLTIFLMVIVVGLILYRATSEMKFSQWFRLEFILIPGTMYMVYRVFLRKS